MKRTFVVLSLCAAFVGVAEAQVKPPDRGMDAKKARAQNEAISKKLAEEMKKANAQMEKYWRKSSLTIGQLAQKVAAATKNPRGVWGQYQMLAQTSEGRGVYTGEMKFASPTMFKVNWVRIEADPRNGILVADGFKRQSLFDGTLFPVQAITTPFKGYSTDPNQLVARFSNEFSRFLFQGAVDGKDPWVPLMTAWGKGAGGYQRPVVEERTLTISQRVFKSYRVKMTRSPVAAKKLGKSTLEVVFDGFKFLPVTVRETRVDTKGKEWLIQWAAKYAFNQKFQAQDFKMATPAKPKA